MVKKILLIIIGSLLLLISLGLLAGGIFGLAAGGRDAN